MPNKRPERSPEPTALIPLYMRGMVVAVSSGTVMHMMPPSTPEHKVLTVSVQGIQFLISRDMVTQPDRLPHLPMKGLPMENNFFAQAIRFHDEKKLIEIDPRDALGEAKFYPVVFDYLIRRLHTSSAPLCVHHMDVEDTLALHALLDVLFHIDPERQLPTSPDGRHVFIATPPGTVRDADHNLCVDPRFVGLVREMGHPYGARETTVKHTNTLAAIVADHHMEVLGLMDIRASTVHKLFRGERFKVTTNESDFTNAMYHMVEMERFDFDCA